MKKMLLGLVFLSLTPVSAYAGPQERSMLTGAAIGATAGAVIGSRSNESVEGAIVGAMFGAVAGALLSDASAGPVYYGHRYSSAPGYAQRHAYHEYREHEMMERYQRRHIRMHGNHNAYHRAGVAYYNHREAEKRRTHERHEYLEHHGQHRYGSQYQDYAWAD